MSEWYQCPDCGAELRQQLYLVVSASVRQRSFDKAAIRKRGIQILGKSIREPLGRPYCSQCGWYKPQNSEQESEQPDAQGQ